MIRLLLPVIWLVCGQAFAEVHFIEQQEGASDGIIFAMLITDEDSSGSTNRSGETASLVVACYPNGKLRIQFHTTDTIHPNEVREDGSGMVVSISHKFDSTPLAQTSDWWMHSRKYDKAFYQGNAHQFAGRISRDRELNIRLNKSGERFRFKLKGTARLMPKVRDKCPARAKTK